MSTQKNIRVRVSSTKANQFTGEMKFKLGQNGYYYTAELYDPRTNSMLICRLEEIEEVRN